LLSDTVRETVSDTVSDTVSEPISDKARETVKYTVRDTVRETVSFKDCGAISVWIGDKDNTIVSKATCPAAIDEVSEGDVVNNKNESNMSKTIRETLSINYMDEDTDYICDTIDNQHLLPQLKEIIE